MVERVLTQIIARHAHHVEVLMLKANTLAIELVSLSAKIAAENLKLKAPTKLAVFKFNQSKIRVKYLGFFLIHEQA